MAIMMRMDWPDATAEQYDELRQATSVMVVAEYHGVARPPDIG